MSTYSRYRRRIGDTVNNGVAWKTPSCICSCQWCIKSEVFCGNCLMLWRQLEGATGCRQGPQYDGKCSFYLNCYFFRTSPTNRYLREKAVYFPPRYQYRIFFLGSNAHFDIFACRNGPSVTVRQIFEFVHCPINLGGISNKCNLNGISCAPCE